jgi:hypothetical protein
VILLYVPLRVLTRLFWWAFERPLIMKAEDLCSLFVWLVAGG